MCINDIKLVNYYDSYDFLNKFAIGDSLQYRAMANFDEKYVNNTHPQISAKGLLTGSMVRTLDADGAPLLKSIYYDYYGNVIQSPESNLVGGFNREYQHLSFTGKPLTTLQVHCTSAAVSQQALQAKEAQYKSLSKSTATLKGVSTALNIVGGVTVAADAMNDINNGHGAKAAARSVTFLAVTLSARIPYVGPFVSVSLGIADAFYGERFYDWVDSCW